MYDIVALGELLIDFTPDGISDTGMQLFSCNPGGAPANVVAMYAKLGGKTAFIGKVGNDDFGGFLRQTLQKANVNTNALFVDEEVPTTLAFVHLDESGNRSFSFYRSPGADIMLSEKELPEELLSSCNVFHFGGVSLTKNPARIATITAAKTARQKGALISYDPNYRSLLWQDEDTAIQQMLTAVALADIVKVSDEELLLLTGEKELERGAQSLSQMGPVAVVVTRGDKGAGVLAGDRFLSVPAYNVKTVDTTGAGDAFWGAMLWRLKGCTRQLLSSRTEKEWKSDLQFANAAGSLATTGKGAIPAMPSGIEIQNCIKNIEFLE